MQDKKYSFEALKNITDTLVAEDGCPWDRVQTHKSLTKYMLEEGYEAVEAANNDDMQNLCEELGDVLLQVMLHSAIAKKNGEFTLEDVVDGISRKMIYRHPKIFNEGEALSWDELKKREKGYSNNLSIIKSIPKALPALMRADKILSKSRKLGFDEINFDDELDKISESLTKLKEQKKSQSEDNMEIIGKILLSISKISNFLQINAEFSLTNELKTYINILEDFD